MIFKGTAYPPKSAQRQNAAFSIVAPEQARLELDEQVFDLTPQDVSYSDTLASLPLELSLSNGWQFKTEYDRRLVNWVNGGETSISVDAFERSKWFAIAAIPLCLMLAVALYIWAIPALSKLIAHNLVPSSVYAKIDESTVESLERFGFSPSALSEERQQELTKLINDLNPEPYEVQLIFRKFEAGPNAFALAHKTIVLTDELVELADSDHEVAAVMAHELGHIANKDVMTNIVRSSIVAVVFAYLVGDSSAALDVVVNTAAIGLFLEHSRSVELTADRYASGLLKQYYGDDEGLAVILSKLYDNEIEIPEWISTHPDIDSRLHNLE